MIDGRRVPLHGAKHPIPLRASTTTAGDRQPDSEHRQAATTELRA